MPELFSAKARKKRQYRAKAGGKIGLGRGAKARYPGGALITVGGRGKKTYTATTQGKIPTGKGKSTRFSAGTIIGTSGPVKSQAAKAKPAKKTGGEKMPGARRRPTGSKRKTSRRPAAKKPAAPMFKVKGQSGTGIVTGSKYKIERKPDEFTIKAAKKPKVKYV